MFHHQQQPVFTRLISLIAVLAVAVSVGCVPEPTREPTSVVSARDVDIEVGPQEEEEPEETPAESTTDTPEATSQSKEMAPETTSASEKPAPAVTETTPSQSTEAKAGGYSGPPKFAGRVTVNGEPPQLAPKVKKGQNVKDAVCAMAEVPDESVVTSDDGGLAHVFVYLRRKPDGEIPAAEGDIPVLDQKGCVYLPHSQIARIEQPLHLRNSDPTAHNVHITGFTNNFNQTVPANDQEGIKYEFSGTERLPIPVTCDFHGWMQAWVLPLDHPWGTVTDANGNFEIENLPEGDLEFVIWHEKIGYIEKSFKATATKDKAIQEDFQVEASKLK